jgi:hypothetical protein
MACLTAGDAFRARRKGRKAVPLQPHRDARCRCSVSYVADDPQGAHFQYSTLGGCKRKRKLSYLKPPPKLQHATLLGPSRFR